MKNFQLDKFLEDLSGKYSNFTVMPDDPINNQFKEFIEILTAVVNKHAPLRKMSRRDKRLQAKPWLFKGLLKSIKRKNDMFSELHKNWDAGKFNEYKAYRNRLNKAIDQAKHNYYNEFVNENKSNLDKLWKAIYELANLKPKSKVVPTRLISDCGHTIHGASDISNKFNEYFANIGSNMAKNIQQVDFDSTFSNSNTASS